MTTITISSIQIKRSFTPGALPTRLLRGEEFVNVADGFRIMGDGSTAPADLRRIPYLPIENFPLSKVSLPAVGTRPARPALGKIRERISILDHIPSNLHEAIATGTIPNSTDLSPYLAAAAAAAASPYTRLIIPSGVYPYSVSPNWAGDHVRIVCEGEVRFRYTGTGNAVILDSGAVTGSGATLNVPAGKVDMTFGSRDCPLIIEAPSTAQHAVFARAIHHSRLAFNVRGCGSSSAGLYTQFGVCSRYDLTVSGVEGAWYSSAPPGYGWIADARPGDPNDSSPSSFIEVVPIIERVGIGVVWISALGCTLIGGTVEGCTSYGIDVQAACQECVVERTDMEANNGFDYRDNGAGNALINAKTLASDLSGNGTSGVIIGATSVGAQVLGGRHNSVVVSNGAKGALLANFGYAVDTHGLLSNSGTGTRVRNLLNRTTGAFATDVG